MIVVVLIGGILVRNVAVGTSVVVGEMIEVA